MVVVAVLWGGIKQLLTAAHLLLWSLLHLWRPGCNKMCRAQAPRLLLQELAERESALAGKESKLAAQHAELADRAAAHELSKSRVEADKRALEQREESLQLAQAELRQAGSCPVRGAGI